MHPPKLLRALLLPILGLALLAACGSDDGGDSADGDAGTTTTAADGAPAEPDVRVLALGEEMVLSDLLALGIRPVASSANLVLDEGFVGLEDADTEGIEPLLSTDPNIEALAGFDADVVVVNQFVVDNVGMEVLEGLADEVVLVPYDIEGQVLALGEAFDRTDEAEALLAELDAAVAEGADAVAALPEEDRTVSVATIYSGPAPAAWVDGPIDVPATMLDLGFTLQPGAEDVDGESNGRVYLSEEQLGIFDAPTMVMLQSPDLVDGEADAIATIEANPLWAGLPAVAGDRVVVLDRLGYMGVTGRIQLVEDLVEQLGGA